MNIINLATVVLAAASIVTSTVIWRDVWSGRRTAHEPKPEKITRDIPNVSDDTELARYLELRRAEDARESERQWKQWVAEVKAKREAGYRAEYAQLQAAIKEIEQR